MILNTTRVPSLKAFTTSILVFIFTFSFRSSHNPITFVNAAFAGYTRISNTNTNIFHYRCKSNHYGGIQWTKLLKPRNRICNCRHRCNLKESQLFFQPSESAYSDGAAFIQLSNIDDSTMPTVLIVLIAIILFAAAQTLIDSMLKGDQGLAAFLSDGSGFNKSRYQPRANKTKKGRGGTSSDAPLGGDDPMPWLRLPRLDFVEVAGQENSVKESTLDPQEEIRIVEQMEGLAERMNSELSVGDLKKAAETKKELEVIMSKFGFEYKEGFQ